MADARNTQHPRDHLAGSHWANAEEPPWASGYGPRFRPSRTARLWMPVLVSFVVQVPAAVFVSLQVGAWPQGFLPIGFALLGVFGLLGVRRWPGPTAVLVIGAAAANALLSAQPGPPPISVAIVIVIGIVRGAQLWVFVTVGLAWLAVFIIGALTGVEWSPVRIAATTLAIAVCLVIGMAAQNRAQRFREMRQAAAQRRQTAEQAERVRIARELHDVLAHSLSQINVQAGVGLHLMEQQPEQARAALENIKRSSKDALEEVREVLGMLRSDASGSTPTAQSDESSQSPLRPQEDIGDIRALAAERTTAALTISVDGAEQADVRAVPHAVQFAAYRIAQEALTNVVRHSTASDVQIQLAVRDGRLVLTIADNGVGDGEPVAGGGLLGMRERAELLGGSFAAGWAPAASGEQQTGFSVQAYLPVRRTS
ncbi:sensor histidine kinase [Lysinibacter cavernae]|uniref:histidine kinase n=1 Tax=Lysinibacter cavernae TaxID=1640652 RepID=A0A7X5R1Q5_9MICO|nr:sensor histidine kinase [Lysinibacter cavernae]NIH54104.1 signal transduction histidine kinase [Lysinibacter cavernae]